MFEKNKRAWNTVAELVKKDKISMTEGQWVVREYDKHTVWSKSGIYYVFPTIKKIDFSIIPRVPSGEGFPKVGIYRISGGCPKIKFWGGYDYDIQSNIISHGMKLGRDYQIDLEKIDLKDRIIKELI